MSIPAIMNQQPSKRVACDHCGNDDITMMMLLGYLISVKGRMMMCEVCSRAFRVLD